MWTMPSASRFPEAVARFGVRLFADGADLPKMLDYAADPLIRGFTTNPTLMAKSGIRDYESFARRVLEAIPDRPVSLSTFASEFDEMERQARVVASWGNNVRVKVPVTNARGESSCDLARRLAHDGVRLNVTALLSLRQVRDVAAAIGGGAPSHISVFAGRIADTGRDPVPLMAEAVAIAAMYSNIDIIWASPREVLNIFQADACGCHIITVTPNLLDKLALAGKDLEEYSLETVRMFDRDAAAAKFTI